MSKRSINPLEDARRRHEQLRSGGSWLNGSPLHLMDMLLSGKNPNISADKLQEEDQASIDRREEKFDSALLAIYGEIILTATERFGPEFVLRASQGDLSPEEMSGHYFVTDETSTGALKTGGIRG